MESIYRNVDECTTFPSSSHSHINTCIEIFYHKGVLFGIKRVIGRNVLLWGQMRKVDLIERKRKWSFSVTNGKLDFFLSNLNHSICLTQSFNSYRQIWEFHNQQHNRLLQLPPLTQYDEQRTSQKLGEHCHGKTNTSLIPYTSLTGI